MVTQYGPAGWPAGQPAGNCDSEH